MNGASSPSFSPCVGLKPLELGSKLHPPNLLVSSAMPLSAPGPAGAGERSEVAPPGAAVFSPPLSPLLFPTSSNSCLFCLFPRVPRFSVLLENLPCIIWIMENTSQNSDSKHGDSGTTFSHKHQLPHVLLQIKTPEAKHSCFPLQLANQYYHQGAVEKIFRF